ncbi:hypothetical protein O3G_MSEX012188 [Manduca sexta]|uniref:Uncharacterized protein n=1 Tax=Manduca sexta TaxID=7130 RepID=A0A922CWA2_MANSE|nr:hypothetical protein O3G_MSEX012188 [Manduca sexta]
MSIKSIITFQFISGNEEKITFIIKNILKFLHDRKFIDEGLIEKMIPQMRKFSLYIILNANLQILDELVNKEEIDLVIWTIPTIPKLLMCEFIYNLHMEQFLYEVIAFSYPPLGMEVAAAFLDHFKYFSPTNCLDQLQKISVASYTLICRLHLFNFGENYSKNLTIASSNFQQSVKYFTDPPNSEKLSTLRKNDLYEYKGRCLTSALLFVYECLSHFTSKHGNKSNTIDDLYQLTYPQGTIKEDITVYNVSDASKEILDLLNECNEIMLDACKQLVMDVSVDIFCAWSEFEENGKTMQQSIGELCHKLRMKLLNIESVCENPLVSMIQQIARKPADIKDLINSTDVATIKDKINNNNNEEYKLWLQALINRDQLCNHIELLDIINSNLEIYNEEECHKLYEVLKGSSENKDYTELLAVKVFQRCNVTVKYELLDKQFSKNCFYDMQTSTEFNQMLIERFNKLVIQPDADLSDVLTLFLQSPRQVYSKLFNLALENPQQTDIMLKVVKLLEKYSNHYYETEMEPCIIKVTQSIFELDLATDVKQNNLIKFICGLKDIDIIPGSKLLLLLIMPNMHKALLNKNINSLNIQIKLLSAAYNLGELMQYRAPILAMLAQVLDVVRWKIHTFTAHSPIALQNTITLQKSLIDTYNNIVPGKYVLVTITDWH